MADQNIQQNESSGDDASDTESLRFIKNKTVKVADVINKYTVFKVICVGSVCLLLGIIIGSLAQQTIERAFHSNTHYIVPENDNSNTVAAGFVKRRKNEDLCSRRRCCSIRDGVKDFDLPAELKCKQLSDAECGNNDEFCEWDCDLLQNAGRHAHHQIKRKYRGISYREGKFEIPNIKSDNTKSETYEDFIKSSKVLSIDDCGVMYEEELPEEIVKYNWQHRKDKDFSRKFDPDFNFDGDGIEGEMRESKRRLDVVGDDGRTQLTSFSAATFPWRAVLLMEHDTPSKDGTRCTATMISNRFAITAAHCVYGKFDWYSNFKLWRYVTECDHRVYAFNHDKVFVFAQYQRGVLYNNDQVDKYDIAWIQLIVSNTDLGYLDFGYDTTLSQVVTPSLFNIISHQASGCTKWYQYCPYNPPTSDNMVTYECDFNGGGSGSALYKYWRSLNQRTIYGLHIQGSCWQDDPPEKLDDNVCNTACMITQSKYNTICAYLWWGEGEDWCGTEHPNFS
eukprot:25240_1